MAELIRRATEVRGAWLNTNMRTFRPQLPTHPILEVARAGGRTVRVGFLRILAD